MPKMKTNSSASKRFKITGNGKILHGHSYGRHLKANKSRSRVRRQKIPTAFEGAIEKKISKMLPYGKS